jgi:hypothetical protein
MSRRAGAGAGPRTLLLLAAVVLFLLTAFDVNLGGADLAAFGLAAFAASFIFP